MKRSEDDRAALARKRILSVLSAHVIANARTLEQKISDAGPLNQRIDPHILTDARQQLQKEGTITSTSEENAPWYYASNTTPSDVHDKLQTLVPIYRRFLQQTLRMGQTLEIATYRALCTIPEATFFGRFYDLDDHDDSTLYRKEEPPQHIGTNCLVGDERLDFLLLNPEAGSIGIECKNIRPWLYPHATIVCHLRSRAVHSPACQT